LPIVTPEDLERRRPVWESMSDLFLDTEVRWKVPFVARICADSGYDDATLERIFWIEVFPQALPNMLSLYGERRGLVLDETQLVGRAKKGRMPWLRRYLFGEMVESRWYGALEVVQWLRSLEESRRMEFTRALWLCGHRYFETPDTLFPKAWREWADALREVLADAWPRYESVCRSMLLKSEASTHDARAATVEWLIDGHESFAATAFQGEADPVPRA
jgi:hypothetical protein